MVRWNTPIAKNIQESMLTVKVEIYSCSIPAGSTFFGRPVFLHSAYCSPHAAAGEISCLRAFRLWGSPEGSDSSTTSTTTSQGFQLDWSGELIPETVVLP